MGLHTVWQLLFFLTCLFLLQFPHCFPDKTHLLQSSHPLHLTSDILTKHKKASGVVVVIWVCIEMELLRHKACIWMPSHPSQRHSDWIIEGGIWHTCTPDSVSKKAWVKNYGELFSVNVFLHFLFMMFLIDLFWVVAYLCIYLGYAFTHLTELCVKWWRVTWGSSARYTWFLSFCWTETNTYLLGSNLSIHTGFLTRPKIHFPKL